MQEIANRAKRSNNGSVSEQTLPISQVRPLQDSQTKNSQKAISSQPHKPKITFEEELKQKLARNARKGVENAAT